MDIFTEIEGLSGENLGSALLRYLIFNSHEVRDAILSLFSNKSPLGPISYSTHFACRTEYATHDKELGNGRLDILIQVDDSVIGIENKFFAKFLDGQPQKYLDTLNEVAESLGKINQAEIKPLLFVMCPASRKQEAQEKGSEINNYGIVTWEDVVATLSQLSDISNPVANVILQEFIGYLKRYFSFIHDFEIKAPHFINSFPEYGSPLQGELVGKLWSFFPKAGSRLSNGKTWLGYYFYTDPEINQKGWFGFVPKKEIESHVNSEAKLIIATTYDPEFSSEFTKIELKNKNFIGAPENTKVWVVNYESKWNSVDVWRNKLSSLWSPVKNDN